tara:strand:+ start:178 stop:816 length:639 start_codon:yes stop_codon:yes gene_type:complete
MTNVSSVAPVIDSSAILADFNGGSTPEILMFIGVGLDKDSDAVYFHYLGNDVKPQPLPMSALKNVRIVDISIYEPGDQYNTLKLNLTLESSSGKAVVVTSGLSTIWSQCALGGLMALFNEQRLDTPFDLSTWKGTTAMKPCFASLWVNRVQLKDQELYEQFRDARTDGNKTKLATIARDCVAILSHALTGGPVEEAVVTPVNSATEELLAEF